MAPDFRSAYRPPLYTPQAFPVWKDFFTWLVVTFGCLCTLQQAPIARSRLSGIGLAMRKSQPVPAQPEFDVLMKPNIDMRRVLSDGRDCRKAFGASEFQAICTPLLFLNT